MAAEQLQVDELLQRYLGLLDEYTRLRRELSRLQAGMYQNLARANFAAERGMRYGRDHYDERMRVTRLLSISAADAAGGVPLFAVVPAAAGRGGAAPAPPPDEQRRQPGGGQDETPDGRAETTTTTTQPPPAGTDPLRWFGLLAPPALRAAQALSVEAVQRVIPRLVSVDAEMRSVEIEVQRARKRRAKALAATDTRGGAGDGAAAEAEAARPAVEVG